MPHLNRLQGAPEVHRRVTVCPAGRHGVAEHLATFHLYALGGFLLALMLQLPAGSQHHLWGNVPDRSLTKVRDGEAEQPLALLAS